MRNNIVIGMNVIMAIAIVLLFLLYGKNKTTTSSQIVSKPLVHDTNGNVQYAYLNSDSVLFNYTFYHKLKDNLQAKQKRLEQEYSSKMQVLEGDYYRYQEKAQKGLLTRAEMQSQEMNLQQRQQEMGLLNQKLTEELANEEHKMQKQLYDSVKLVTDLFNKDYGFKLIFNSATSVSIVTADSTLDITKNIVELLNNRYKK